MDLKTLLFSFGGRLARKWYWIASLILFVAMLGLAILGAGLAQSGLGGAALFIAAIAVLFVPVAWASAATGAKRLHDRGKSAWWLLLYYAAPTALDSLSSAMGREGASFILTVAAGAISIWGLVELGFLKGTTGPNRYGPDPLAQAAAPATAV